MPGFRESPCSHVVPPNTIPNLFVRHFRPWPALISARYVCLDEHPAYFTMPYFRHPPTIKYDWKAESHIGRVVLEIWFKNQWKALATAVTQILTIYKAIWRSSAKTPAFAILWVYIGKGRIGMWFPVNIATVSGNTSWIMHCDIRNPLNAKRDSERLGGALSKMGCDVRTRNLTI